MGVRRIIFGISLFLMQAAIAKPEAIVEACVMPSKLPWHAETRTKMATCLGWQDDNTQLLCRGSYHPLSIKPQVAHRQNARLLRIRADQITVDSKQRAQLSGDVQVEYEDRILSAKTAYLYRNPQTQRLTTVELLGDVIYTEPGRLMRASQVVLHPEAKTGTISHVLYRFHHTHAHATLPAFGQADLIERYQNRDLLLRGATYTTCSPKDKAWLIRAESIQLDEAKKRAIVRDAVLELHDTPVLYTPYLSFPTTKERKTGFLMPTAGFSNVGGGDLSFPFYLNLAPNYDATLLPRLYTRRGWMFGGDMRLMTHHSNAMVGGNFLPSDRVFKSFIQTHALSYPVLRGASDDRWSVIVRERTEFTDRLSLDVNYQQVSDDYFLQDFSNNMTVITESQLLQEGALSYTGVHWFARGMLQAYQTLNPINQSPVNFIYQRLPQLQLRGDYDQLPLGSHFEVRGQYDLFRWPERRMFEKLEGPRYHVNPVLSLEYRKPWGYFIPEAQLVENHYDLNAVNHAYEPTFDRTIPRYNADAGLIFERNTTWQKQPYKQTFEPRLYYLYVPYKNQSNIPVFDSAYMIFRYEQLFRTNRFSGFDRISDGNQLAYAFRSRLLTETDGDEKMSFSIGQLGYFSDRKVQLCYAPDGQCMDNRLMLGYTSPIAKFSPIASVLSYTLSPAWKVDASWSFDVFQNATNNANMNMQYEPETNHIVRLMYSYLVDANIIFGLDGVPNFAPEHQATIAFAWPLTERWSSLGVYSYNISKQYDMVSFLGLQYESCCWALRAFAGRSFNNLTLDKDGSQYYNSVYVQLLLKGLGAVSTNDPATTIRTYLPTYKDSFHHE